MGATLPPFMDPRRAPGEFTTLQPERGWGLHWYVLFVLVVVSGILVATVPGLIALRDSIANQCPTCTHDKHPGRPCGAWYRDRQYITRQCACEACPAVKAEEVKP